MPEWQSLEEGQRLSRVPKGENWTVVVLEPDRTPTADSKRPLAKRSVTRRCHYSRA